MTHAKAPLTPVGRAALARLIVVDGWAVRRAAERYQVSPATASKWAARWRAGLPMDDLSSRPHTSPTRLPVRTEHRIVAPHRPHTASAASSQQPAFTTSRGTTARCSGTREQACCPETSR